MKTNTDEQAVLRWLKRRRRILLLSHERPDGDALGSLCGTLIALHRAGICASAYLSAELPNRYKSLFAVPADLCLAKCPGGDFDGILCLDTTDWKRLDIPGPFQGEKGSISVCQIDHHPDNELFGDVNWVEPGKAATAQMVAQLFRIWPQQLTVDALTCLLAGILADTGGLRFGNTDSTVLAEVAQLVANGAPYKTVIDTLFLTFPYERLLLESWLIQSAQFALNRRLVYAVLTPEMLDECRVTPDDTEGLVDRLKMIDGAVVVCLLQPEKAGVRLSLRSRDASVPVNRLAQAFGGGGHTMAAGARLENVDVEQAVTLLISMAQESLMDEHRNR